MVPLAWIASRLEGAINTLFSFPLDALGTIYDTVLKYTLYNRQKTNGALKYKQFDHLFMTADGPEK